MTLNLSIKNFVSLRETVEHLNRYLELEQLRNPQFTSRILVHDHLDVDDVMLPPMIVQPFVENALWHGVSSDRKDIDIKIDFKKNGERLECIVEDNGIGIQQAKALKKGRITDHKSFGLENVRSRLAILNNR